MLVLSLLPLGGMSLIVYHAGRDEIQDRIRVSLGKMAQDAADKIDMVLRGKREELHAMAISYSLLSCSGMNWNDSGLSSLLNEYFFNHEGYDLLLVIDASGKILGINTADRNLTTFPAAQISDIVGTDISTWPQEGKLFLESINGRNSHANWYQSEQIGRAHV